MAKTVEVDQWPNCDLCERLQPNEKGVVVAYGIPAYADAKLRNHPGSPWAYVCSACFEQYGCELGTGKGQILVRRQ